MKSNNRFKSFKYKNITFLFLSFLVVFFLYKNESFHAFLLHLGNLGYLGAFIAGILFVSTFTVATGTLILLVLAEKLSPIEIGLIAGLGAVVGDTVIFKFIKDNLIEEVRPIYNHLGGGHLSKVMHTRYFSWTLPVIGALIIASPLPDEVGVSLMGISKMKTYKFLILSFILNAIGIFIVITASTFINP
ncbi:MAG TPA: hypothetical protein VK338_02820 [Candidatus Nitrosocosmicus sp.]|nr:hypothetical protein [Candidatus Nitrosocosmicus sp.]